MEDRINQHIFVDDVNPMEDTFGTENINKANSQQVITEDKGNTSPSPPPRKKRQPMEGGCIGDSLTPADTNSQNVQEESP